MSTSLSVKPKPGHESPLTQSRIDAYRIGVTTGRGKLLTTRVVVLLSSVAAVTLIGLVSNAAMRYSLIIALVYAIAIIGNGAVTGLLGEINLSAGAYMAFGAYMSVYAVDRGVPLELAILLTLVSTAVIGFLLAIPTTRLTGIFTALVTFALASAIPDLIVEFDGVTGGNYGTPAPVGSTFAGIEVGGSATGWLVLMAGTFALIGLVSLVLLHGRLGRTLLLVSEAKPAAECFGFSARRLEIQVWTFAATLCGLAGAALGLTVGYLTPELFPVFLSIIILVGCFVGGPRSPLGALIGGLFIGVLPQNIQAVIPPEANGLLFGAVMFAMLFSGGLGVAGLVERTPLAVLRLTRRKR